LYNITFPTPQEIFANIKNLQPHFLPFITDTTRLLWEALDSKQKILLEGAQGSMLDIDHGTYPFVTSSTTTAAGASSGTGIAPKELQNIIGIAKAYCTRVGNGPFPTEENNQTGELIGQKGFEFGTTTGRKRRCGWIDAIALKYACKINGCNQLALMKLDVLDGFSEVKICTKYQYHGQIIDYIPSD
ncbi:adenylosuccinate synthetase, partial [Campylobacter lari]|uniref:adenylosuccinate synthetase n=2 Tax=Campylobacterales TaxID=213849 RepID=UPI00372C546E